MSETVTFQATVSQVKTLADGGIRIALDLPESAVLQAAQLMECKRQEAVLLVVVTPGNDDEERPQRKRLG